VVDNRATFKAQLAATGQGRVRLPRVLGWVERAATVGERPLDAGLVGWRALPQVAYTHQWAGRFDRAAQLPTEALPTADTAARGATTHQRIGKRRFDQGDDTDAPVELKTAIRVRPRAGAARSLSVSSAMAAHPARELAGR